MTISQKYDLAFDVAEHLVRNYGTRAGQVLEMVDQDTVKGSRSGLYKHYRRLYEGAAATTGYPYLEAEVRYAVNHEYAVSPADVLARRTRLAFLNSTAARLCLPRVVEIMAEPSRNSKSIIPLDLYIYITCVENSSNKNPTITRIIIRI